MKVAISFISGAIVCSLLLFGAGTVIPTQAENDNSDDTSGNIIQSLIDMLPDIEGIYRDSLIKPFEKAESKIYDEDIAEFYRELLDSTGLRTPDEETS